MAPSDSLDRGETPLAAADIGADERARLQDRFGLLDSAPDPMVIVDGRGRIVFANSRIEAVFGFARDEIVGRPVEVLIPARFRDRHAGHRDGYFEGPRVRPMGAGLELLGLRKDGSEFPVEVSLSPLATGSGLLVVSTIRDVTDRKRTEEELVRRAEELARSNAELDQFAFVASHDLQEPLRVVSTFMQRLAGEHRDRLDERANEYVRFALDAAHRMRDLVSDLLAYSRAGDRSEPLRPVDCDEVYRNVVENLDALIRESDAEVTADPLPTVIARRSDLVQLFQNLIHNAITFRGERRPRVHVSALRAGDEWRFSVRDEGIGIAPEQLDRIFRIFQRLHGRSEYPGTGVGLAICRRVVDRLGGRIWAESEPGRGSTFHFSIPVEPGAAAAAAPTPDGMPATPAAGTRKPAPPAAASAPAPRSPAGNCARGPTAGGATSEILLVEDNPADVRLITEALREGPVPVRVTVAPDGEAALEVLRERSAGTSPLPDLILLDLNLPKRSGREVLEQVKRDPNLDTIPVIVLTGSGSRSDIHDAYALQASSYVQKPGCYDELVETMASIQDFWLRRTRR